jgi:hypothetical protein
MVIFDDLFAFLPRKLFPEKNSTEEQIGVEIPAHLAFEDGSDNL